MYSSLSYLLGEVSNLTTTVEQDTPPSGKKFIHTLIKITLYITKEAYE